MRFDDRIATVLALPQSGEGVLKDKWRQLVDLVAQGAADGSAMRERAMEFLYRHKKEIDPAERERIAATLVGKIPDDLNAMLAPEEAPLVSPVAPPPPPAQPRAPLPRIKFRAAPVSPPRVSPPRVSPARASPPPVSPQRVSPPQVSPPLAVPPVRHTPSAPIAESQIQALVERLEAFRKRSSKERSGAARNEPARSFRWEADADGAIVWVDGVPREALIGQTVASSGLGRFGVDGQVPGAFKRRAPFRDARFSVAGAGPASGDWRISGVPFFDPRQGTFHGYRGSARRPRLDEIARASSAAQTGGLFGTELQPDALRQLIHELRTPLNAVQGFAEMIDGQYLGPAGEAYRRRAQAIREEAGRLLASVDDLDTAARIETSRYPVEESSLDIAALLSGLHADYGRLAHHRNSALEIAAAADLPLARVEPATAERMCSRLLAATIGLAAEGERLIATISVEPVRGMQMLCVSITRPRAIAGKDEAELLDPGYTPEGDWPGAPVLGLGFALRLVRNLAEAVGGSLAIAPARFLLYLPPAGSAGQMSSEGV